LLRWQALPVGLEVLLSDLLLLHCLPGRYHMLVVVLLLLLPPLLLLLLPLPLLLNGLLLCHVAEDFYRAIPESQCRHLCTTARQRAQRGVDSRAKHL
jgi:hypothetical protein